MAASSSITFDSSSSIDDTLMNGFVSVCESVFRLHSVAQNAADSRSMSAFSLSSHEKIENIMYACFSHIQYTYEIQLYRNISISLWVVLEGIMAFK